MGIMDELKKLTRPYAEDEDLFGELRDENEQPARPAKPARNKSARRTPPSFDFGAEETVSEQPATETRRAPLFGGETQPKVVNISGKAQKTQFVIRRPTTYDDKVIAEIADQLRAQRAVILNLEATQKDVSRRLVDFMAGCAYALDGQVSKIALATFLVTPNNVDLVSEDVVNELENNGLYM